MPGSRGRIFSCGRSGFVCGVEKEAFGWKGVLSFGVVSISDLLFVEWEALVLGFRVYTRGVLISGAHAISLAVVQYDG